MAWLGDVDVAIHDDCFLYRHTMNPAYVSYYTQTDGFHSDAQQLETLTSRAVLKKGPGQLPGYLSFDESRRENELKMLLEKQITQPHPR